MSKSSTKEWAICTTVLSALLWPSLHWSFSGHWPEPRAWLVFILMLFPVLAVVAWICRRDRS